MITLFLVALSILLTACTDYAQKILDKYEPDDDKDKIEGGSTEEYHTLFNDTISYRFIFDGRDGHGYRAVELGGTWWMAENLNYDEGDSWCYNDNGDFCNQFGRLYTWKAARKACPDGWRLPTKDELENLKSYASVEGLKSAVFWPDSVTERRNGSGFSAIPAGIRGFDGTFDGFMETVAYWSDAHDDTLGTYLIMRSSYDEARINQGSINYGFSVRCVESESIDEPEVINPVKYGEMTDSRDGKTYKTVVINNQEWMTENLNFKTAGSYCYENDSTNCDKYGRLYFWSAAMDSLGEYGLDGAGCGARTYCSQETPVRVRGICPEGWRLPTQEEFDDLVGFAGGGERASRNLRSTSDWLDGGDAKNAYGFFALPAGIYWDGHFTDLGYHAYFWTASQRDEDYTYALSMSAAVAETGSSSKDVAYSIRCIKDDRENASTEIGDDPYQYYKYYGAEIGTREKYLYGRIEARMKTVSIPGSENSMAFRHGTTWEINDKPWYGISIFVEGSGEGAFTSQLLTRVGDPIYQEPTIREMYHGIGLDLTEDFHLYSISWTPDYVSWEIDSVEYHRISRGDLYGDGPDADQVAYLLDSLAVYFSLWARTGVIGAGDFTGKELSNGPLVQLIDYVRYYSFDTWENEFVIIWEDEFEGNELSDIWVAEDREEDRYVMTPNNVVVEDGYCKLKFSRVAKISR